MWRKRLWKWMSGVPLSPRDTFERRRETLVKALLTIRVFYAAALFHVAQEDELFRFLAAKALKPVWCVAWVPWVGVPLAGSLIMLIATLSAAACTVWPYKRWLRVVFAIAVLQQGALNSSFGKIEHAYHAFIIAALLLCFLPAGTSETIRRSVTRSQTTLLCVWSLYASLLLVYTISGLWKVGFGFAQLVQGEVNAFSPLALAYHVAGRLVKTATTTDVAEWLLRYPRVGWPLNLFTIYFETFAIVAAFRPRLHRVFALGLIAFHLGSGVMMDIGFHHHVLLLGLLGLCSPFAPEGIRLKEVLLDLPLFGDAWRMLGKRRS